MQSLEGREAPDPMAGLHWVEARDNPYGLRLLDCACVARTMTSMTSDESVAQTYSKLRESRGEEHQGKLPEGAEPMPCDLRYGLSGSLQDGPLFKSSLMEEKWDIYLHQGHLYFCRSWTGELVSRARLEAVGGEVVVSLVEARPCPEDPSWPVRETDFLIKTHLIGRAAPHPLPAHLPPVDKDIALYSFGRYGNRGMFASYEDTTAWRMDFGPPPRG